MIPADWRERMKMRFPVLFLGVLLAAFLAGAAEPGEPGSYPLRKLLTRGEGNAELGAVRVDRDLAVRVHSGRGVDSVSF